VCELATSLLQRGHTPIVYSPQLGRTAHELREATVPVVDNLDAISSPPDLIHGQHHVETMAALLRFPNTPAVFFCHGWLPWEETPPKHPRILHYVAVDDTCRDRLLWESAVPEQRVSVILNSVETEQFLPRPPLPTRPSRAVVFSNGGAHVSAVREACLRTQLTLDVVGADSGNVAMRPQDILGQYDIVFAKARCALEALAVGSAVVLCDTVGVGPMVTTGEMDQLRRLNFGVRTLQGDVDPDVLEREIARYDPRDAAEVSRRIREGAGREKAIDQVVDVYHEVVRKFETCKRDVDAEARAESAYLQQLAIQLEDQRNTLLNSQTFRLRQLLLNLPFAGRVLRSLLDRVRTTTR
jgi:Glycosyltransferase Family 4